jgi:dCMP deaminase
MKWDARFMELAKHVAGWSKDPSSTVGAVIVRPDRTICSIGFNGLPRGVEDRPERLLDRDQKLRYMVHAEANAILSAREPLNNYSLYVWPLHPCCHCAAAIIQSGIKEVHCPDTTVTRWSESFDTAKVMFTEARITLTLHTNNT